MLKSVLMACTRRMKASLLTGKPRDDAADHFMAGARAALEAVREQLGDDPDGRLLASQDVPTLDPEAKGYLSVLEALATAG
jgi:hypothetical protein